MEEDIYTLVKSYIEQARDGSSKENNKFDFKREWYDLTSEKGISRFLKAITSIANTFGPDGYIVIGYDEDKGTCHDAKFQQSGLIDKEKVYGLINKRVDRLFEFDIREIEFEGKTLSIIHIPPSIDKPHVIKRHYKVDNKGNDRSEEHRIFVRKSTTVCLATKYDLELMFYDRKNIEPDYRIFMTIRKVHSFTPQNNNIKSAIYFNIENTGKRPLAITQINLLFQDFDKTLAEKKFYSAERMSGISGAKVPLGSNPFIIGVNSIISEYVTLTSENIADLGFVKEYSSWLNSSRIEFDKVLGQIVLDNGSEIQCELKYIEMKS